MYCEPKCTNDKDCSCPTVDCPRHGKCCECVANHKSHNNLPKCLRNLEKH